MTADAPGTSIGIVPLRLSSVTIVNRRTGLLRHTSVPSDTSAILTVLRDAVAAYPAPFTVAIDMPGWRPGAVALEEGYRSVQLRTETAMRWVASVELLAAGHGFAITGKPVDVRLVRTRLRECLSALVPTGQVGPHDASGVAGRMLGTAVPDRHANSCCLAIWASTLRRPAVSQEAELRHG